MISNNLRNMGLVNERIFMKKQRSIFDFAMAFLQDDRAKPIDEFCIGWAIDRLFMCQIFSQQTAIFIQEMTIITFPSDGVVLLSYSSSCNTPLD